MRVRRLHVGVVLGLAVIVAAAVAVSSATSAGSAAPAKGAAPSGVSAASGDITLAGFATIPTEVKLLKQVLRGFSKTYPNIHVTYEPIASNYDAEILARTAAHKPPDVFYVDSNRAPDWIKQGLLTSLDKYISDSKTSLKPFFPSLLQAFTGPDKKIYGLPKDWSPLAMETNNAMFAKAGIKASSIKTWADLTAAAKKLKSSGAVPAGSKPICLGADWARLLAFVYQNKGSFLNANKSAATVNTPAVKGAAAFYVGLIKSGLAATPDKIGSGWCGEALGKEKAAIAFEGNWVVGFMADQFPNVKFTINPMIKNKQGGNLAFTVSYSMARESDNKDAAWQLIRYLTGRVGMKTWTSKGFALPSRSDVPPAAGRSPFLKAASSSHPWQFAPKFSSVIDTANNELTAVIEGKESIGEMLKKINSAANDALHS